ncbi:DUF397 domain-containing protein [Streptomyces galbus]|uniref:DUF397 domain-containing protein n=1 Tax=Streptomyces galbus TaxID=33898 RepID=A0A4U5X859_STRGB|nr:DUF397 domain-containing protein [Streptomyces galbus]TKT11354.1 DUF397 domain-containing protein [Streptomyces galbus]GHD39378.1 toxin [Streptomyces galbus]
MASSLDLTRAQWRKSSFSGSSGGECVECAPLGTTAWHKSSYSGNTGGDCVEVADLPARVAVRDSKNPGHGILTLTPEAFAAFVAFVRA